MPIQETLTHTSAVFLIDQINSRLSRGWSLLELGHYEETRWFRRRTFFYAIFGRPHIEFTIGPVTTKE